MALTYSQIKDALRAAIVASLPDDDDASYRYVWVADFSDAFVVYELDEEYLQDDYTITDDGDVTLAGKPSPVKPVTTFEPLGSRPGELRTRTASARDGSNLELLVRSPNEIAKRIVDQLQRGRVDPDALSSELVYTPSSPYSYYRDLILSQRKDTLATERLSQHGEQMDRLREIREQRMWERLSSGGFEYRLTPDRTDGHGGYAAPPIWLNQLFATANRPGRVLAGLMARFPLPPGVAEINLPILTQGTDVRPAVDDAAVLDQDITDSAGSSSVVTLTGDADVALQLLEQSPAGAHLDWALFMDMSEAYDADLETELLAGTGGASLLGALNVPNIISVAYTDGSPTGSKMWKQLSKVPAQIGDERKKPPEAWLMRTARWAWFEGSEDTAERPFGLSTKFFLGNDDNTPDPVSGMMGWPVFLDDAIPANLGTGGKQDVVLSLRPRDMLLLEGEPQTLIAREPLSGSLGVRLQMHCRTAAISGRRPAGIGVLQGTGMTVQSGW